MPSDADREREEVARRLAWFGPAPVAGAGTGAPLELGPRWVHVQRAEARREGQPGGVLGRVAWEEHVEACEAGGWDPERVAARGGWGYAEMVLLLGREPSTWRAW